MKHLGFASIAALKQYLRYATAHKLDTRALIQAHGLEANLVHTDEGRITGQQFEDFLADLVDLACDPILGLTSALYVKTNSYSLLGTIAEQSATLGEAIDKIPVFERLVGDMGITQIERTDTSMSLTWECNYANPIVIPHMVDNVLASWTLYARWLTNSRANPIQVRLARQPVAKDIHTQYARIFNCPILFGCERNSITLDNKYLSLPLQTQHRASLTLEGRARSELAQLTLDDENLSQRVVRTIRAHLQLGIASKPLVAQEFNMSERNLQRQLAKEGNSYRALLDQERKHRALNFLKHSQLTPTEIAYNLGYQDERSFFRSIKRWTDTTPGKCR